MSDPVTDLLARAAADGHTWLPEHLVAAESGALAAAAGSGAVVRVDVASGAEGPGWALADLAETEDLLAEGLLGLAEEKRLAVVAGPPGPQRAEAVARLTAQAAGRGAAVHVAEDAEGLTLDAALDLVGDLPEDALLLLAGDPAALGVVGPGDVLVDIVESGRCPVVEARAPEGASDGTSLDRLRWAVREGRLTAPEAADRSFVVVPVPDDATAVRRAVQVATVSVPRAFDLGGAEVAVLTPLVHGPGGRDVTAAALTGAGSAGEAVGVLTVAQAVGRRWAAVVLVLPPTAAGVLDRATLVTATGAAQRHLTVVHGAGPDLARAVAVLPRRPRRTRLARLLAADADSPGP